MKKKIKSLMITVNYIFHLIILTFSCSTSPFKLSEAGESCPFVVPFPLVAASSEWPFSIFPFSS